jgi:hypothetical protein
LLPLKIILHLLALVVVEIREREQLAEAADRRQRRAELVAHPREELVLRRVRGAKLPVRLVQLPRALEDLGLHPRRPLAELGGQRLLLRIVLLQAHELGDVLDAVDDVGELSALVEDG